MGVIHSSTKYNVNPTSDVCVNPDCPEGLPHYKDVGKVIPGRKCYTCGRQVRRIQGEPYGTKHPPRR